MNAINVPIEMLPPKAGCVPTASKAPTATADRMALVGV